jgi:O-antigen/teichoic acid export membrane protein
LTATLVKAGLLWSKQSFPAINKVSKSSFQSLFSFGSKLLIGGLMQTIYTNLYTLVIGKFFNVADVGCFNRSKSIADFPSYNISSIVTRVMYPKLCKIQGDDNAITNIFFKALRSTMFIVFPSMFLLLVLSKPIILALLTSKWIHAVPMLSIMCFALMWIPLMQMNWTLLNVKGRSVFEI